MGFDLQWLALREPIDAQSRNKQLLDAVLASIEASTDSLVVDVACGTGSTYRSLHPQLRRKVRWRLIDNDHELLEVAEARHSGTIETIKMDLNDIDALPLDGAAVVTASALFDLCSLEFIERFSRRLSEAGTNLYAALNFDGEISWVEEHHLDHAVTRAFNVHQRGDKGFGPSLGPEAWKALTDAMRAEGYHVQIAESPWVLREQDVDLHLLLLQGIVTAVEESGQLDRQDLQTWYRYRSSSILTGRGLGRNGHRDLFASR